MRVEAEPKGHAELCGRVDVVTFTAENPTDAGLLAIMVKALLNGQDVTLRNFLARENAVEPAAAPKPVVYLFGYTGHTPEELVAKLVETGGQLVDIRFSDKSRVEHWQGASLRARLRQRYTHLPSLGNENYKNGGPIKIANLAEGLKWIDGWHTAERGMGNGRQKRPLILMCTCDNPKTCHRTTVGAALAERGYDVRELFPKRASKRGEQRPEGQKELSL
jgi:hypothetical protein